MPVLKDAVIRALRLRPHGIWVDCTLGGGGHAEAILEATAPDGLLFGIDRDGEAVRRSGKRLERYGTRVRLLHDGFKNLGVLLRTQGVQGVDGILMDLGVSTMQLMDSERGFSFQIDGPLDMRMDRRSSLTAAALVNSLSEPQLVQILFEYGEERWARRITRAIVRERQKAPVTRTLQLADLVRRAVPRLGRGQRIHPATRTFQALRIAVNQELDQLGAGLSEAVTLLNGNARLCVISFHSLEDRIVKRTFKALTQAEPGRFRLVTKKPVVPGPDEIRMNPRARSAKLRGVERVQDAADRNDPGTVFG
ncbi:MAG TPA: 16S rRNA (cytosine(1402)-N(4))-methyltransferase RsmH [Nitrospiria bacterium]|nr:16S rRNA (cytosine(1402)-N(4))-methyltransferase RsmH [Nitrospiria bacterium]